jgi:hypothetical protein
MDWSVHVLGSVGTKLQARTHAVVLRIGRDTFDRVSLSKVQCFNFTAAANLSRILTRDLEVKDTRDLFDRIHPQQLVLPRLGAVSLAVLGAAFEAKGIGGATPLANWYRKHLKVEDRVTFTTLKTRTATHEKAADDAKPRKAARRDTAHRLRVDRFLARQGAKDHDSGEQRPRANGRTH